MRVDPWLASSAVDPDLRTSQEPTPPTPPLPPLPLLVAAATTGVEAVALVLLGVAEIFALTSSKLTMGVTTTLFFLVYGVGLGAFAWLLGRLRSWTRAPIVLTQLIQLGLAWSFRSGGTTGVSVLLAVLAVVVLVGIFHPASLRALDEPDEPDEDSDEPAREPT